MTNFSSRFFFFPLLILALILHFSVFGDSPHNPYGIKGLNEAYLAVSIVFAILLLLLVLLLSALAVTLVAVFANLLRCVAWWV